MIVVGTLTQDAQAQVDLGERENGRADAHKKKAADVARSRLLIALVWRLAQYEKLGQENCTVRSNKTADCRSAKFSAEQIRTMSRGNRPALDGKGTRIFEALIIRDVFGDHAITNPGQRAHGLGALNLREFRGKRNRVPTCCVSVVAQ